MKNIGIMGPDGKPSPIKEDKGFNLAMSQEVSDALSEKCERVKQLESWGKEITIQYIKEINELKDMVQKIGEENLRLKNLLKEHEIEY